MILPLEKQCCSLESARKLKELGCPQNSLFYWYPIAEYELKIVGYPEGRAVNCPTGKILRWELGGYDDEHYYNTLEKEQRCSAYTVAELGEMLPHFINNKFLTIRKFNNGFDTSYMMDEGYLWCFDSNSLAESCAKMLIYLLENKLMEAPK